MTEIASAKIDFLTNCYTRESLSPYVDKMLAEFKAYDTEFTLLLLDIDHFKHFNDKYGHLDGDQVLKYFSSSLRLDLAKTDCTIFRFGGDEFVVVFPGKGIKDVKETARMMQATFNSRPFLLGGKLFKMSFSGGIVSGAVDGDNLDQLFARADKAMYVSKKMGRARTTVYNKIGLVYLGRFLKWLGIALGIILITGAIILALRNPMPSFTFNIKQTSSSNTPQAQMGRRAVVRLTSGASVKGKIIKENDREVEVSLALEMGEGSITIKKSMIKSIDRD